MSAAYYTSAIAVAAAAGVVIRPFRWPEAVWAVAGALLILALVFGARVPLGFHRDRGCPEG